MPLLRALLLLSLLAGAVDAAEPPDLSGSWIVDLEASDPVAGDIGRRLEEQKRENTRKDIVDLQAEGEAFGGERRASNRALRNDDGLGGGLGAFKMASLLDEVVASGRSWEIVQSERAVTLTGAQGEILVLCPNEGSAREETGYGTVEVKWKGRQLVAKRTLSDRSVVRQTWALLHDGRLEVVSRITPYATPNSPVRPLSLRLVYDRTD